MMTDFRKTSRASDPRRVGGRQLVKRILVVSGGEKTEIIYLDDLRKWVRNSAVKIVFKGEGRSPREVVEIASTIWGQDRDAFDEVWTVFDEDDYDLRDALEWARSCGIRLAVSKPCFELWLLLHFQSQTAHLPDYDAVLPLLKRHVPRYVKNAPRFTDYRDRISDAYGRSKASDIEPEGDAENPSSGVWRLVSEMYPAVRTPAAPRASGKPKRKSGRQRK